jgi:oligopeptide/dipeptide ABC transporter ATP-binding protein
MERGMTGAPILEVTGLRKSFPVEKGLLRKVVAEVKAVDGVSLAVQPGETLCLVGESGCGKSTVGKLALGLIAPTGGTIRLDGEDITGKSRSGMQPYRKRVQMVFQDPSASLNPRLRAGSIVGEPMENYAEFTASERRDRVAWLFGKVGLRPDAADKYPFEFSGGQKQRLGIARALALQPGLIVADEPVSALDVSVQAQVINLMVDLQEELKLSYLFVAHDLGVVEHISHRVAVMYLGKIVEIAPRQSLFEAPRHPYSEALLAAVPVAHPRLRRKRVVLRGDVPSPINPPPGCRFHTRCPIAVARCREAEPPLVADASGHAVACHLRASA